MLTVKLKQSECWNHYINDQSALNEIFLFLSTHSPIKIHVNVHIPWQAGERRGEGGRGSRGLMVAQQEAEVVVVATGAELTPAAVLLTEGVHA